MGLTKEQLRERSINKLIDYVKEHGTKISKSLICWDIYPVCVKDICVTSVGLFDGKIVFGDFDQAKKEFISIRKTTDELDRKYIDETLEEMIDHDKSKKKK